MRLRKTITISASADAALGQYRNQSRLVETLILEHEERVLQAVNLVAGRNIPKIQKLLELATFTTNLWLLSDLPHPRRRLKRARLTEREWNTFAASVASDADLRDAVIVIVEARRIGRLRIEKLLGGTE